MRARLHVFTCVVFSSQDNVPVNTGRAGGGGGGGGGGISPEDPSFAVLTPQLILIVFFSFFFLDRSSSGGKSPTEFAIRVQVGVSLWHMVCPCGIWCVPVA